MKLPPSEFLSISRLEKIYFDASASYKFFWFMSILDIYHETKVETIKFWDIIAYMIGNAWFAVAYNNVKFNKKDLLAKDIKYLQSKLHINRYETKNNVIRIVKKNIYDYEIKKKLKDLTYNVPYHFLSPWILSQYHCAVAGFSLQFYNDCLYAIKEDENQKEIMINKKWQRYLLDNYEVLINFSLEQLCLYLQKYNPQISRIESVIVRRY